MADKIAGTGKINGDRRQVGSMPGRAARAGFALGAGRARAAAVGMAHPAGRLAGFRVDLFIMISGFLMVFHYVQRRAREPWQAPST